jgi:hypothetical protein
VNGRIKRDNLKGMMPDSLDNMFKEVAAGGKSKEVAAGKGRKKNNACHLHNI